MADNIVVWICAGAKSEDCDALFQAIENECMNRNAKAEIVFENPEIYKVDNNLREEYSKVKSEERFFNYSCSEVCSGSMWKEISENFDNSAYRGREIFLFGIFKGMSEDIFRGYRYSAAGYTINVFVKNTKRFERYSENIEHNQFPETGNVALSIENGEFMTKRQDSPKKKKRRSLLIGVVIVVVAALLVAAPFGIKYFFSEKKVEESSSVVTEEVQKEKTTASPKNDKKNDAKKQAEKIYTDYLKKSVDIEKKDAAETEGKNYEAAVEKIDEFSEKNAKYSDDIIDFKNKINSLYVDRINYISGMQSEENLIALYNLEKVTDLDSEIYEKAQEKIVLLIEAVEGDADELAANKDYRGACEMLDNLARTASYEKIASEAKAIKEQYIKSWIELSRSNGDYFSEEGAVRLAYEYGVYSEEEMKVLIEAGYAQTKEKLYEWINEQRVADPYSYETLKINQGFEEDAQRYAKIIFSDGSINEKRNLYNINDFGTYEFTEDFESYYGERFADGKDKGKFINGVGEFVADSADIGIGMYFDPETNRCIFVVITSSGEEKSTQAVSGDLIS